MRTQFARWVVDHPKLILLLIAITLPLALIGTKNLWLATDYKIYFKSDNPDLRAMEKLEATFGKEANVILVVAPKSGDVFDRKVLDAIGRITDDFWQLPFSGRVESLTNYKYSYAAGEDDLVVEALFDEPELLDEERIDWAKSAYLAEPNLVGRLLSKDASATLVFTSFNLRGNSVVEVPKVSKPARDLLTTYRADYPDIDFYLTGSIIADQTFADATQQDLTSLIPISYLLIVILLVVLLRSVVATVLTLSVVGLSITYAVGLWAWFDGAMNPVVASAPTIILTIAVADCIHLTVTCYQHLREGLAKKDAVYESIRINIKPICVTSVTTALGFLCLNFSESPPFQQLGNLVAIGVLGAMVLSLVFMPAAFILLPVKNIGTQPILTAVMSRLGKQIVRRSGLYLGALLILTAILFAGLPRNQLNETYSEFFDETFEIKKAYTYVDENITGLHRLIFSLDAGGEGAINEPAYLEKVGAFADWLRSKPEVAHVHSMDLVMKRLNQNLHQDDEAFYRLPENRDLAAQYLLLYELSLPFGEDLNNRISQDKSQTRLVANLWLTDSDTILRVSEEAEQWLVDNGLESMRSRAVGIDMMFSHIARTNIPSMVFGSLAALVLISLLIMAVLRSGKLGAVSLVSNLFPILMALGLWGFLSGRVGLGEAIVASVTLGLVVDDTVHFLTKYQIARNEKGLNTPDAIQYAFSTVGVALLVTTIVLALGFAVLTFSHYSSSANLGFLTATTIIFALLVDLIMLPAILMKIDGVNAKRGPI